MKIFGIPYQPRQIYYLVGDTLVVALAVGLAHLIRFQGDIDPAEIARIPASSLYFLAVSLISLSIADAYNTAHDFRRPQEVVRLLLVALATFAAQVVVTFALGELWWGRGVSGLASLSLGVLLPAWRALVCQLRPGPVFTLRTLIVGDGEASNLMARVILDDPEHRARFRLVGALRYPRFGHRRAGDSMPPDERPSAITVLGPVDELRTTVDRERIELVIVAIRGGLSSGLAQQLLACKAAGVQIEEMPTIYKRLTGKVPILHTPDAWLIFGPVFSGTSRTSATLQRVADILCSLLGLFLSAPFIAVAAVAVKLDSKGPAFYLQERVGRNEEIFRIVKLRTMRTDAEAASGAVWSQGAADPRVTRVGRFLRRTRIDELPQFWNVLRGDMSIVGPRPERLFFVRQLEQQIPFYALRHSVKPGVTGWAQVNYRYGASVEESAEKLCYELFAIQELTPVLYAFILLKTVQTMLLRPGS
jgi:exopolysaccharide biosynthesis polyprenyl glycosylphosphotransferase